MINRKEKMSKTRKKAFTIIEVVLVLAIAGLIFLMVFIAFPALSRSRRDTQRRSDLSKVIAQIQSYQVNNNNLVPNLATAKGRFLKDYLKGGEGSTEFTEPKIGKPYDFRDQDPAEGENGDDLHLIQYKVGYKCNGEDLTQISGGGRVVSVRIKLESGGIHCRDNQ